MIDLAAFQANGDAYIKLRLAGTVNSRERRTLNVQHRTSNIDDALRGVGATTLTSRRLRFIHLKTSEPQNFKG